jgi:hypothetical protein
MKWLILFAAFIAFMFSGCSDYYRYPCQDPKNWETAECKPPICTVTQTCPEDLLKPEVLKGDVR